jgi:hypothetical protein
LLWQLEAEDMAEIDQDLEKNRWRLGFHGGEAGQVWAKGKGKKMR